MQGVTDGRNPVCGRFLRIVEVVRAFSATFRLSSKLGRQSPGRPQPPTSVFCLGCTGPPRCWLRTLRSRRCNRRRSAEQPPVCHGALWVVCFCTSNSNVHDGSSAPHQQSGTYWAYACAAVGAVGCVSGTVRYQPPGYQGLSRNGTAFRSESPRKEDNEQPPAGLSVHCMTLDPLLPGLYLLSQPYRHVLPKTCLFMLDIQAVAPTSNTRRTLKGGSTHNGEEPGSNLRIESQSLPFFASQGAGIFSDFLNSKKKCEKQPQNRNGKASHQDARD